MKYLKNTSWLFLEKIFGMILRLFIGVWVARYLGPENFGLLSYSQSFVGLFALLATMGLDGIVIRELVKAPDKKELLLGTSFILKIVGSFLMLSVLYIATTSLNHSEEIKLIILIIGCSSIFQSFHVIDFYFKSRVLSKYVVYASILSGIISNLIKVYLILNKSSILYFALNLLFDSVTMCIGLLHYFRLNGSSCFNWKFDYSLAISLFKDSYPRMLSGVVIAVYMKIDQVMLQEMIGSEAVGHYAAAVRLSLIWNFIPIAVCSSFFPALVKLKQECQKLYYSRLQKLYDLQFSMAFTIGLPIMFFSEDITSFLYGGMYDSSGQILKVHILCSFFVFMGVVRGNWIINENLQKYDMFIHIIGAISNILFNYFFIKKYGVLGAAYGTVISYMFTLFFSSLLIKQIRPSFFMIIRGYYNILSLRFLRKGYFND
ncbi:MAG: O-unit flippase [Candidatus Cloacimonadota bacterium]|nr:MAG: O-unit flippase [Candidatus Cloacimonadota bacterium]